MNDNSETCVDIDDIQLFKSLLESKTSETNYENQCLISNELLSDNSIKLECGHSFNYQPLYNEVYVQKIEKNQDNRSLKVNQMKCPYCRKIIDNILPYYNIYKLKKIHGVNTPEKYSMIVNRCDYIKKGNIKCDKPAFKYNNINCCNLHVQDMYTPDNKKLYDKLYNEFKKMKIVELKEKLKENNAKIGGNKDTLINRLINKTIIY